MVEIATRLALDQILLGEIDAVRIIWDQDLIFRCRETAGWSREIVVDGMVADPANIAVFAQFPDLKADRCGNPHLAFYYSLRVGADESQKGVYYATRGEPCIGRSVSLDLHPDMLNLRSRGRWVTASVAAEGASIADIDAASLALNRLPVARWSYEGDTLVAKFDRQAFAASLEPGQNVVTLTGRWNDGGTLTATDTIRVMRPGR